MAYCAQADIEKRISLTDIIALTDDAGAGAVDDDILDEAISQADDRIDSAIRGRFTLPLVTIPRIVKAIAVDMVVYHLYTRRPSIEFPKVITDRYKEALEQLAEIASGALQVFSTGDAAIASYSGDVTCNKTEDDQIFDTDTLDLF